LSQADISRKRMTKFLNVGLSYRLLQVQACKPKAYLALSEYVQQPHLEWLSTHAYVYTHLYMYIYIYVHINKYVCVYIDSIVYVQQGT